VENTKIIRTAAMRYYKSLADGLLHLVGISRCRSD